MQHTSIRICLVIGSPKYKQGVDLLGDLLAMERGDPIENAVWLLEHVSETKGAEHLKVRYTYDVHRFFYHPPFVRNLYTRRPMSS